MSLAAKASIWVGVLTGLVGALIAVATYGSSRVDATMTSAVVHESRHVQVESDVQRIDGSMEDHFKVIQAQLEAGHQMNLLILERVIKE